MHLKVSRKVEHSWYGAELPFNTFGEQEPCEVGQPV